MLNLRWSGLWEMLGTFPSSAVFEGVFERRFEGVLSIYCIHNKINENKNDTGVFFFNYRSSLTYNRVTS